MTLADLNLKYEKPGRTLFTADGHAESPPAALMANEHRSLVGRINARWIPCENCFHPREVFVQTFEWELKPGAVYEGDRRFSEKILRDCYPCLCWDMTDALTWHQEVAARGKKDRNDRAGRLVRIDAVISQFLKEESIISITARAKLEEIRAIANGERKDPNAS